MTDNRWSMSTNGEFSEYVSYLIAGGRSQGTVRQRMHYLRALARTVSDPLTATESELLTFLARPGWAPETRKSASGAVRGFYGWLTATGRIPADPSAHLPPVRVPAAVARPAPEAAVRTAMARTDDRGRLLIGLAYWAGLRRSEIAALPTSALQERALFVEGKGGRVRIVPLRDCLWRDLVAWIAGRAGWVFPSSHGGHLTAGHVGKLLARMLGEDLTGHQLRHAAGTRWYRATGDLLAVQALMGHSRPETTQRYVQLEISALRRAVEA